MTSSTPRHGPAPPPMADSSLFPLGARFAPPSGNYRWVAPWGAPLRAMHWIAALAIVVLIVTGLYIGRPYFLTTGGPPQYLMGYIRLAHFIAAGVLVMTGLVRVYWLFAGNQFERLPALFPIRKRDWVNLWTQVKYYLMIGKGDEVHYIGHNPLQQLSYTFTYVVAVVVALTGFAMFGQANPGGFWYAVTQPMTTAIGGIQIVRLIHHLCVWWFIIFPIIHIYLVLRKEITEHGGGLSGIVSGGHYIDADVDYVDE
jgi:Ni/Fe-hydrogenase 1 B-type cytochrome subunit